MATFSKGDKVYTDTGVNGVVEYTYKNPKGELMVKVKSSSYVRGSQSIKASRLHKR